MRYDISKPSAPKMPKLGKGTECIKLLLSQASKDMHEPPVPMFFPTFVIYLVLRKNCTINSFGRCFEAKWLTSLQKVGVTRANCHYWWKLFVVIFASTTMLN